MDSEVAACETRLLNSGVNSAFMISLASECWARAIPKGVTQKEGGASTARSGNDPGVNLAGEVSVGTSPAPHNSSTTQVDPEAGAGGGLAGSPRDGQDAVVATGPASGDTPWPSSTPAMQGPFPVGTTSDGPPGHEPLLVTAGRVNESEQLQPHNIDMSEEETADANAEQVEFDLSPRAAYGNPQVDDLDPDFGDRYGDPRWSNNFEWDDVFIHLSP